MLFVLVLMMIFLVYVVMFKMQDNQYMIVMMMFGLVMVDIMMIRPIIIGLMGYIEYNGYNKGYGL